MIRCIDDSLSALLLEETTQSNFMPNSPDVAPGQDTELLEMVRESHSFASDGFVRWTCRLTMLLAIGLGQRLVASESLPPNFLLIIADDCTYRDLEVYGGQAKSPHLNRLAAEGMTFTQCFQAAPMCSPTRHCLYTGLYPVKSGAYPNHTLAYDWVQSIVRLLEPAGYRSYLSGKSHVAPPSVFPFETSQAPGEGDPDPQALKAALEQRTASQRPFLFIAASHQPHSPWNHGDASAYPPADLNLPPILVDTAETREAFSRYLAEITYFDRQVGELLAVLEQSPQRDQTVVMVLTEQGNSFPFAKWTCYDVGLASGCLIRWPGKVSAGVRSSALIEYVDVVPTFMEIAGLQRPASLDGRSFYVVCLGRRPQHKECVFGLQTTRGINAGSEYFGIRAARNQRYRYIRNLTPEATFQNATTKESFFESWRRLAQAGDAKAQEWVDRYQHRPAEELYDCLEDPWNQRNLIDDSRLASVRDELRQQLEGWMKQQGDEGQATEMRALDRMPRRKASTATAVDRQQKSSKKKKGGKQGSSAKAAG
jgi:N-sulfoglucosamine sulfohydrolase